MRTLAIGMLATIVAMTAGYAHGQNLTQARDRWPAETVQWRRSELPGYAIATQKCSICHSVDYIAYQPPAMTLVQWRAEVTKMQATYGAPLEASDVRLVATYLAATYGDPTSISADDLAATRAVPGSTAAPAAASSASKVLDAQALLGANGCLACHALQQKVVGPAYHDVAAKYRSDANAVDRLKASIRQGGMGRWGNVPMPAFPGLDDAQLDALAKFVLKQ